MRNYRVRETWKENRSWREREDNEMLEWCGLAERMAEKKMIREFYSSEGEGIKFREDSKQDGEMRFRGWIVDGLQCKRM